MDRSLVEIVVGLLAILIAAMGAADKGAALAVHDKLVETEKEND
jgi:hypothetical protein